MNEDEANFDAVVKDIIKKTLDGLEKRIMSERNVLAAKGKPGEIITLILSAMVFTKFYEISETFQDLAALMTTFNATVFKMVEQLGEEEE